MVTWQRVIELAHALPEVEDSTSHGGACFRIAGKAFAGVSRHEGAIWARCDREERPLLVASDPELYRLTPHFERSPGYLLIWLEHATEQDVRERLEDAWLIQAPRRLLPKPQRAPRGPRSAAGARRSARRRRRPS